MAAGRAYDPNISMIHFHPSSTHEQMTAFGAPVSTLVLVLSRNLTLGRPVIDKTGLTGRYDFNLSWAPSPGELGAMGFGPHFGGDEPANVASKTTFTGPSIFTALQEQLGLKLKSAKGPVQVLVVDHIEPPTPN